MDRPLEGLSPKTRWLGQRIDLYRCVDSTNRVAQELAREGAPEGTLVLADAQSAGRGRLGRSFFSPGGRSIYLSAILRPPEPPDQVYRYIFVAAVSVAVTAKGFVPPSVDVSIKWPNDVMLDGRKTSGINLPVELDAGRVATAVLGIGVNVNLPREGFPAELRDLATSLSQHAGHPLDRVAFAEALIERLEADVDRFRRDGFHPVLEAWQGFFRMRGLRVRVGGPGVSHEIEGRVEGIDHDGALLLSSNGATHRIVAGDVTLAARR